MLVAVPETLHPARVVHVHPLQQPGRVRLQARIQRFQLAQGVTPDGRAGPLTLMLLNRVNGVSEPRLRTGG